MGRIAGNKSTAPRKGGSSLLTGILIGMVIGAGMAAGVAWYIMKSPSPFVQRAQVAPPPTADASTSPASGTSGVAASSGVSDTKPRFEFYKVLTDKPDANVVVTVNPVAPKAPAAKEAYYLQAGSFTSADEAENLRARLTLMGMEVNVQTASIPGKGIWHRVRVGPFRGASEMNNARATMKQNGIETTPMHGQ
ncbi:MAG: SPOR domain-containing protein [Nitrosomonadales bacterium]|nr:SPOR domain-containing protein [Nitrosomonadales bacterium]